MASYSTPPTRQCSKCGESNADSAPVSLSTCSRCRSTYYCSQACQVADWPSHKDACKHQNYILKFCLRPDIIKDPDVTHTLSVPATTTFADLHEALQIAFGWANIHAYDFAWHDPTYVDPVPKVGKDSSGLLNYIRYCEQYDRNGRSAHESREFVMRITEKYDPGACTKVDRMHEAKDRQHPRTLEKPSEKTRLWQILEDPQYAGLKMEYMYDFGDYWYHVITVEGRTTATDRIICTDGNGHGVAEDVNPMGWGDLKEAFRTAKPTREQKEQMVWFKFGAANADPQGLHNGREHVWDINDINQRLATLRL